MRYEKPIIEITFFETECVIRTSGGLDVGEGGGDGFS